MTNKNDTSEYPKFTVNFFHFEDWTSINPFSKTLHDAVWLSLYDQKSLKNNHVHLLRQATQMYLHLSSHVAPDEIIIEQLIKIRKAARKYLENIQNDQE
jgi:hypothetical protein